MGVLCDRLFQAADALGLTIDDLIEKTGICDGVLWDAKDGHEDEIEDSMSLRELRTLSGVVRLPLVDWLAGLPSDGRCLSTWGALVSEIREHEARNGLTQEQFDDRAGWELSAIMTDPERMWELNLTALRDVCNVVRVNWRELLISEGNA